MKTILKQRSLKLSESASNLLAQFQKWKSQEIDMDNDDDHDSPYKIIEQYKENDEEQLYPSPKYFKTAHYFHHSPILETNEDDSESSQNCQENYQTLNVDCNIYKPDDQQLEEISEDISQLKSQLLKRISELQGLISKHEKPQQEGLKKERKKRTKKQKVDLDQKENLGIINIPKRSPRIYSVDLTKKKK